MIRIQLNNEWMDTYIGEEIQLSWTGFRFQKELRAGYTNDLSIPKTEKNLKLLRAVGLLDSQTQLFGTKTVRCILQNGLIMTPMMLQVAGVTPNEIKICLYENSFPEYYKGKTISDFFVDNTSTIWPWKASALAKYPSVFKRYNYGMPYNGEKAQYHPVKPLRDITNLIASYGNYTMPSIPQSWMLMATKKTVCPYNRIQVIEANDTSMAEDGITFNLHGGQHITNNLSMDENTIVTYNRDHCYCKIKVWVAWRRKSTNHQNRYVYFNVNGQHSWWIPIQSGSTDTGCEVMTFPSGAQNYEFNEGDTIGFSCDDVNKFDYISIIAKIEYTSGGYYNYITKDDFGIDMEYVGRDPSLRVKGTIDTFLPMDGNNHAVHHSDSSLTQFPTENLSFAYFGYYCNLPEIKICDLWSSLQWLLGGKIDYDHQRIVSISSADNTATIEGYITEIRPKSDKIGQKNYIKFKDKDAQPAFSIPNEWLSESVTLFESIFLNTYNPNYDRSWLPQYSNPEYNEDWRWWTTDFNEVDGVALMNLDQYGYLQPIDMQTFDFTNLNQCMEVDITTFTPMLRDKDIIYLDGRRFLVISGKCSLDNQKTELTCLLWPKILNNRNNTQNNR